MLNSFLRLWHHAIVSCNDKNHHVRDLRTTCTHTRESRVTWRINKRNHSVISVDVIGTDVLSDPPGFASSDAISEFGQVVKFSRGLRAPSLSQLVHEAHAHLEALDNRQARIARVHRRRQLQFYAPFPRQLARLYLHPELG